MNPRVIRNVFIRGRVQGVGYRAFTEYTAVDHGLEGWVRNRCDGGVEAVFAGSPERIADMLEGTSHELALRGTTRFAVLPTV